MQARACEGVMGGFLDTMCQNIIVFASKTDRMVIWTKLSSKLEQINQKHDRSMFGIQFCQFDFLERISSWD